MRKKVLWLCNIVLPELCGEFSLKSRHVGGWLTGMWNELKKQKEIELAICTPLLDKFRMKDGVYEGYNFYSFHETLDDSEVSEQVERFKQILNVVKPDIIHIWGTESVHSYAMMVACRECMYQHKVIINIQGLISVIAKHYLFGLPGWILEEENTLISEKEIFEKKGKYEIELFKMAKIVIGRTDWDKACVMQINNNLQYYNCGEILRPIFYESDEKWQFDNCMRYSIFMSQASAPIKGLHLVLNTFKILADKYIDFQVFIAGKNISEMDTEYAVYLKKLIKEYQLEKKISFLGSLSPEEIYKFYLKANVYLSASTIENSPNSICEAMHVGTPVVASYVGGVPSMIENGLSGFLFPLDEIYMMQYNIEEIFNDGALANKLSLYERKKIRNFNDKEEIMHKMLGLYNQINKTAV